AVARPGRAEHRPGAERPRREHRDQTARGSGPAVGRKRPDLERGLGEGGEAREQELAEEGPARGGAHDGEAAAAAHRAETAGKVSRRRAATAPREVEQAVDVLVPEVGRAAGVPAKPGQREPPGE